MPDHTILDEIRGQGLKLSWIAGELRIDPSHLRKKLLGQRPPLTETQARHLRAILGVSLDRIPHRPDPAPSPEVAA